jgi:hypothetical protein
MRKYLFFFAAAAALVACSKNEVIPAVNEAETEITYTVAPKVRSTINDFDKNWNFESYAYYLANATGDWAANHASATEYIKGITIEYDTNVWRNKDSKYYWPKAGKLTFFAYTNVTESIAADASLSDGKGKSTYTFGTIIKPTVTNTTGVKYEDYDVVANKNVDILVADMKADQTKNVNTDYSGTYTDNRTDAGKFTGVPTLFRHKLSKVIFTAQTKDGYDYETKDGITFTINSITFKGIDKVNTYTQGVVADEMGEWGTASASADQIYYKGTTTGVKVTKDIAGLYADGNQYLYLPQKFTAETSGKTPLTEDVFVVNYTIKYANGTEETIEQECVMNNSDTNVTSVFKEWEMAKVYYINLKFSLDEILWDPAVEDWTEQTNEVTINPAV